MKRLARVVAFGAAMATMAPALADEGGTPLTSCAGAVGTWLTTNPGKEPSRSLLSLTADGLVLFADSGEGGGVGFAPFTGSHGAWRCTAVAAGGGLEISATMLDFTLPTVDWPNQRIARLDIAASVDPAKGTMNGTMKLHLSGLDEDPIADAKPAPDAEGPFSAVRITAP